MQRTHTHTHTHTHKPRCQRAQEESRGVWSEPLCLCFVVFQAHWLVWFWLQVSPTELCQTQATAFQCTASAKRSEDEPVFCFALWSWWVRNPWPDEPTDVRCVGNKTPCCYFVYQQFCEKMSHVKFRLSTCWDHNFTLLNVNAWNANNWLDKSI